MAFIIVLISSAQAVAEYRVFKLQFMNSKTNVTRQIQSTLDPEQYQSVYPVGTDESLTYVQTWRCKGNTNHYQSHCQSPELKP